MSCFIIVSGGSITGIDKNVYRPAALTSESVSYKARFSLQVGGAAGGPIPAGQGRGPAGEGRRGFARPRTVRRVRDGVRRAVRSRRTARHCECRVPLPRRSPAGGGPVPGFPQRFEHPLLWDSLSEHSAFRARLNFPSPSEASAPYIHGFAPPQSTAVSSALYLTPSTNGKTECNSNTIDIEFTRTMD